MHNRYSYRKCTPGRKWSQSSKQNQKRCVETSVDAGLREVPPCGITTFPRVISKVRAFHHCRLASTSMRVATCQPALTRCTAYSRASRGVYEIVGTAQKDDNRFKSCDEARDELKLYSSMSRRYVSAEYGF